MLRIMGEQVIRPTTHPIAQENLVTRQRMLTLQVANTHIDQGPYTMRFT